MKKIAFIFSLICVLQANASTKFLCNNFPVYKQYELRIDTLAKVANIDTIVYSSSLKLVQSGETETVVSQKVFVFEGKHNGPELGSWKVTFNESNTEANLTYKNKSGQVVQVGTSSCQAF